MEDRWIRLSKYCELTGETEKAVRRRLEEGKWIRGQHARLVERRWWVNFAEAQLWVTNGLVYKSPVVSNAARIRTARRRSRSSSTGTASSDAPQKSADSLLPS